MVSEAFDTFSVNPFRETGPHVRIKWHFFDLELTDRQRRRVRLGRSDEKLHLPGSVDVSEVPFVLVFGVPVFSAGTSPLLPGMILNRHSSKD